MSNTSAFPLKPAEAGSVLLRSVQRLYSEKKLFDVNISCNGRILFGCHKLVLASCSSYFESLLSDTEGLAILNLDAVDADYVKQLSTIVDFMYGHKIVIPKTTSACHQLYEAARIFGVTALIKTLDAQLSSSSSLLTDGKSSESNIGPTSINREDEMLVLRPYSIAPLLLVNFQRFKDDGKFIDAKICCRDQLLFACHKVVLASFSDYFETLLSTTEGSAILDLDAVDELYMRQLGTIIGYMYGNTIWMKADDVDFVRDAAQVFGIQALVSGDFEKKRKKNEKNSVKRTLASKLDLLRNRNESTLAASMVNLYGAAKANQSKSKSMGAENGNLQAEAMVTAQTSSANVNGSNSINIAAIGAPDVMEVVISQGRWTDASAPESATSSISSSLFSPPDVQEFVTLTTSAASPQEPPPENLAALDLCRNCGMTFSRNTTRLRSHLLKHQVPISWLVRLDAESAKRALLKCAECREIFQYSSSLRLHWEATHGTLQIERGCFQCNLVFVDQAALKRHVNMVHMSTDAKNGSEHIEVVGNSNVPSSNTTQRGPDVSELPSSRQVKPRKIVSKLPNDTTARNSFNCKACGYSTTLFQDFVHHANAEHCSGDSICHACDQTFADRQTLNMHYHNVHNLVVHICHICSKIFKTSPGYQYHMDSHGQEKRCDLCSFTTTTKKNLEIHMKKHHPAADSTAGTSGSDHLKFKCTECSASFMYECLLTRHYQTKHLKLKPFKCPYCGHTTTEKAALQMHVRCVHTKESPFQCDMCDLRFKTKSILSRHRRVHTGEKPHICDKCGEAFTEKRDLTVHNFKVHEKVRPFKCAVCSVGFFRKDNLLQHERTKHKKASSVAL